MPEQTGRFEWVLKLARIAVIGTLGLLTIILAMTVAKTVFVALEAPTAESLIPLVLQIVGELVAAVWIFVCYGIIRILAAGEFSAARGAGRIGRVESILSDQNQTIHKLLDLASLSDQAKTLIFHQREIELMRETIHADLMRQDYKTAEAFIDRIETRFGYTDEAARLRQEVEAFRRSTEEEKTDGAINRIQEVIDRRDWARASREAQLLAKLFPNSHRVADLPRRIEEARVKHKGELLRAYGEDVKKNDVDGSIELLRELDAYLTPQEGAALEESARDIFRKKLHNLGVQFAIFVNDKQWAKAVATGDEIMHEYPNTRMAQEAREKMDQLRALAAGQPNSPT